MLSLTSKRFCLTSCSLFSCSRFLLCSSSRDEKERSTASSPSPSPSPSSSAADYTFEDFLNDTEDFSPSVKTENVASTSPPPSLGSDPATTIANTSSNNIVVEERKFDPKLFSQRNNEKPIHSLHDFLVRCNELLVLAKSKTSTRKQQKKGTRIDEMQKQQQQQQQQQEEEVEVEGELGEGEQDKRDQVRYFWNMHVARVIETNVRSGHDLACVARAGRGLGLLVPASGLDSVFVGWSILKRNENLTSCKDLMSALSLLVRSHYSSSPDSSSKNDEKNSNGNNRNIDALHADHQRFALSCIQRFFTRKLLEDQQQEQEQQHNQSNCNSSSSSSIPCPVSERESVCDALAVIDSFTVTNEEVYKKQRQREVRNLKKKQDMMTVTAPLTIWKQPPVHALRKMWKLIGEVHSCGVVQSAKSLSFSQLVQCLTKTTKLYLRCKNLLTMQHRILSQARNNNNNNNNNNNSNSSSSHHPHQQQKRRKQESLRMNQRVIHTLEKTKSQLRNDAATCLFENIIAQATVVDTKFCNSFHFTEVVYSAEAMGFLSMAFSQQQQQRQPNSSRNEDDLNIRLTPLEKSLRKLLAETFRRRTSHTQKNHDGGNIQWKFDAKKTQHILHVLNL